MRNKMRLSLWFPVLLPVLLLFSACAKPQHPQECVNWHHEKVAVVLPMEDGQDRHWKQTLQLLSENMKRAFSHQEKGVAIDFEFYDENTENILQLAEELAGRSDLAAVIGCSSSAHADVMAWVLGKAEKTFFTIATAENLIRAHASDGYLWAMTETDITQCEVLLSKAIYYGAKSVALIANSRDYYGKTFIDWFAFQAAELNLKVCGVFDYALEDVYGNSYAAMDSGADFVICAPSAVEDVVQIKKAEKDHVLQTGRSSRLLFSDTGFGAPVLSRLGEAAEGMEGVCFSADPESGFEVSYRVFFEEQPALGVAQVYDAGLLLCYAFWYRQLHPGTELREALRQVVSGRDPFTGSWMPEDMEIVVRDLALGKLPDVCGASGKLDFDSKIYTNVLETVYCNYKVYGGEYIVVDYNSGNGGNRTDATLAGWNWKVTLPQDMDEDSVHLSYPGLKDKWALLVAASSGWNNYRHQADVLSMYQFLKSAGYQDDHIVLIMEDDLARNVRNPNPGVVQCAVGGPNLYHDLVVDYRLSDLFPEDVFRILMGKESDDLKEVLHADGQDNVLVFWCGHGEQEVMKWGNNRGGLTYLQLKNLFGELSRKGKFRKLLWMTETCYSASVMQAAKGVPGILTFASADVHESSKADVFSSDLNVWMTNCFSNALRKELELHSDMTLKDLYQHLYVNTLGSHVMVCNSSLYGNLNLSRTGEFFIY